MRTIKCINENWTFQKQPGDSFISVSLPHTWNNKDGQDGGNDYYRGTCVYRKQLGKIEVEEAGRAYLEFRGVNSSAKVIVNNIICGIHDGGYSTFRVDITNALRDDNILEVIVDNSANTEVYPQRADFTFYGGIYRDVYLVTVSESHFELGYYGSQGIKVTPEIDGTKAEVHACTYINGKYDKVRWIIDGVGELETPYTGEENETIVTIEKVHLWDGLDDPYQYQIRAELIVQNEVKDSICTKFGCRTYSFDKDTGFILNGRSYPLRGVSRHQDREGAGNALTKEMQEEDIDIILEMGANSIRLAHYQHDQYVYDLCDEKGIVVWAEIPYITSHMPEGRNNTISQMKELIVQNYNHPSIICWALSNEITLTGVTEDLMENHYILNDIVHKMDKTRVSAMAALFMLETDNALLNIPDIISYNLYYGWYVGELEENDKFFDDFHAKYPDKIIGLSEYGADAVIQYQTAEPRKGDYTEQYQCVYHEHMLEMISKRPYLWSTYLWNMFEFAADGRDEADAPGVNHKGVVTFDRKIKKDAFYIYKAWWSKEPFVHICGRRYADRTEDVTEVKVYTNQNNAALYVDGKLAEEKQGSHAFVFSVPISGEHKLEVRTRNKLAADESSKVLYDSIEIRKAECPNTSYQMESAFVRNWFDEPGMEVIPGYFSIQDRIGEIKQTPEGKALIDHVMKQMMAAMGDVAKDVKMNNSAQESMVDMLSLENMLKHAGRGVKKEMVIMLNKQLNKIKKAE